MASLYELSNEYAELLAKFDTVETEEEADEVWAELDKVGGDINQKADAYARIMKIKQAEAEMFKTEKTRLEKAQKRAESVVEGLKSRLLDTMKRFDIPDLQTSIGNWHKQQNPWSCEVLNVDEVPMEYHVKQPDKIDRKALLSVFKETGELIPGVKFDREMSLRFR